MTDPYRQRVRSEGSLFVALPPARTLSLFTPAGERAWAPGWDPHFPAGRDDDSPGTLFVTNAHETKSYWVVTDRGQERMSYSRVTPGHLGGTVSVRCRETPGGTRVEVVYDSTALSEEGAAAVADLASGFDAYMQEWETLTRAAT